MEQSFTQNIQAQKTRSQTNQKLFQNYFIEYMVSHLLNTEELANNTNPLLSVLFEKVPHPNMKEKWQAKKKNFTKSEEWIIAAFIRSYFFSVSFELSICYAEQLGLLDVTINGAKRFAEYIAQCCFRILKGKNSNFAKDLCGSLGFALDHISLKSLLVLAGINQKTLLHSNKTILMHPDNEISISKLFEHMGIRSQLNLSSNAFLKKGYHYYCPQKKSVKYGYRNAAYILNIASSGILQLRSESNGNGLILEDTGHRAKQINYSYVATIDDIREYLDGLRNSVSPMHEISQNGFNCFISELYCKRESNVIVACLCLDLSRMNLAQTNFNEVYFSGCNFTETNLTNASFEKSIFSENTLEKTIIDNTSFNKANLDFIDLSRATIKGSVFFENTKLCFTNLEGIVFKKNTNFEYANIASANCIETDFSAANTNKIIYERCITSEVRAFPDKRIKMKIFDNDDPIEDVPFQPYLICKTQPNDIASLLNALFNDNCISRTDQFQLINFQLVAKLVYGLYATHEVDPILQTAKKIASTLTKLNRQHACEYFINFLESLYVRKLASKEVILQERSFKTLIMTELNVFLSNIIEKNCDQIEECAAILAQDIFYYNRRYFSALEFSELKQGSVLQHLQETASNFILMQQFSDRLTYKVCQDILLACHAGARSKIYQLYLLTALKLCDGFQNAHNNKIKVNDLQGASSIVMAFCHHTLSDLSTLEIRLHQKDFEKLSILLKQTFNPAGNFKELRLLTTKSSIPYLAQLSKDYLFTTEVCHTLLEQMTALGKMQRIISMQQTLLKQFQNLEDREFEITTNLTFMLEKIDLETVNAFFLSSECENIPKNENLRASMSECSHSGVSFFTSSSKSSHSQSSPQISKFKPIDDTLRGRNGPTEKNRRPKSLQRSRKLSTDNRPSINIDQTHLYEAHMPISECSHSGVSFFTSSSKSSHSQSPPQISPFIPIEDTLKEASEPPKKISRSKSQQRTRKVSRDSGFFSTDEVKECKPEIEPPLKKKNSEGDSEKESTSHPNQ